MSYENCIICGSWHFDGTVCPACDGQAEIERLKSGKDPNLCEGCQVLIDGLEDQIEAKDAEIERLRGEPPTCNECACTEDSNGWYCCECVMAHPDESHLENKIRDLRARLDAAVELDNKEIMALRAGLKFTFQSQYDGLVDKLTAKLRGES